tara:strand:- start:6761 stop:7030 length:270 start_codon:yes stop_codon:yes gene_type:complete
MEFKLSLKANKMNKKNHRNYLKRQLIEINKRYKNIDFKTSFIEQGIDSIDFFTFIFKIEEKFKIKIPSKKYLKLNNILKIEKYLSKKND